MKKRKEHIVTYRLDPNHLPRLTAKQKRRLDNMKDEDIDYSDIPDLSNDDEFWRRARLGRPGKKQLTLRLDSDVIDWFKSQGKGYQTTMGNVLRTYMKAHLKKKSA